MFADVVKFEAKSRRFGKSDEARRCLTMFEEAGWTVTMFDDVSKFEPESDEAPKFDACSLMFP
jgi:hypothetical protein